MANSYIDPSLVALAAQSTGPGWEWNPGQTFVTAFNNAQENQRLQQKRAEEAELAAILLPAKRAEAEFNIKKLAYDSQLLEKIYRTKSAALDETYRGVTSAIGGANSNVPNGQNTTQPGVYNSRYGFGSKLTPTANTAQPATSVRKQGSGLMPKIK